MCSSPEDLAGKGLFTALDNEAEWGVAHRILIPAFSLKSIQKYFPEMSQVARRLLGRLDEFGDNKEVPIGTYMTKLTFDTIGICGFNYDFHGVDSDTEGDFIKAMFYVLGDTLLRRTKPWSALQFIQNRKYKKACDMMMSTVAEVVRARAQETPEELAKHGDLLSLMLTAQDPQTSLKLTEQEMAWQIITFLIAGSSQLMFHPRYDSCLTKL
jgi:cytochrome P450/NADPH-cytochrome P450 reductase